MDRRSDAYVVGRRRRIRNAENPVFYIRRRETALRKYAKAAEICQTKHPQRDGCLPWGGPLNPVSLTFFCLSNFSRKLQLLAKALQKTRGTFT